MCPMCVLAVLLLMNSFCWMYSALRPFAKHKNTSISRCDRSYWRITASQRSRNGAAFFGGSMIGGLSAPAVMTASSASFVSESSAP